jgi:rhodanese-related sulfurtransferase
MKQLAPKDLADWLADSGRAAPVLLDVREPWEFETCHLAGAQLIPMREVSARLGEFDLV